MLCEQVLGKLHDFDTTGKTIEYVDIEWHEAFKKIHKKTTDKGTGHKQAEALMRAEGFPSIRIGRSYRVEEDALSEWLSQTKSVKLDYSKC